MRHGRRRRRTVPVFYAPWNPDNVTFSDLLGRASPLLNPACARRDDQCLAERVGVPCCPGAGLERDPPAGGAGRIVRIENGLNAN